MKRITILFLMIAIAAGWTMAKEEKTQQQQPAAEAKAAEKVIDLGSDVKLELVYIPAGEFDMGSPLEEIKRDKDEIQHHVKITKPFYMGKYEVTQLQYRIIMGQNPSKYGGDNLPVDNVNWYEAARFLKKLSDATGLKFRFPTEAEWEYACRAGRTTAFNTGTTIDSDFANYDATVPYADGIIGNELKRPAQVGSYQPNAFGLYDMHGNVWEWCSDFYDKNYYKITAMQDPQGPAEGGSRVIRGGAWNEKPHKCRSADRNHRREKANQPIIGFRVVLQADE